MRILVSLLSLLVLACGSKGKSSSGGGIPATTSYAAAGKIGSADVKDSVGFVLTGKEDSSLRLSGATELELHKITADGKVEKVKFMDTQGSEISDAPAPAILLTPSKKYLVLSFADEKVTYVINIETGAAYKIEKIYAGEAQIQPLYNEDVIFVVHSDSGEFYEDTAAYMIDMKDPDNPVVTKVSAADQAVYFGGFDKRSLLVDASGDLVYRGVGLDMGHGFLRTASGDFSQLDSIPWLSGKGQLQRRDSSSKLIDVVDNKEIPLTYTARLGYAFSQTAVDGLSSVCITLQQSDGTGLAYYDFDGASCQALSVGSSTTVADLSALATACPIAPDLTLLVARA